MSFSSAFLGQYDHLNSLIDHMKNGNQQGKDEFTTTTGVLIAQLDAVVGHAKDITTEIRQFSQTLNQDMRSFKSDSEEAQTKIIGDKGDLKRLRDMLVTIIKAIDRDRRVIAGGIFIGWLAEAGAMADLKKREDAKHDVELKMAMERQELMALKGVESYIDGFVGSIIPVSSALMSLELAWASLKSDFEEVTMELKRLSTTSAAGYLDPLLETAKKDWTIALDRAKQLQSKTEQLQGIAL